MADRHEVQAAFGAVLTIEGGASLSPWSDVWAARVHGGEHDVDAVVKRTWRSPAPLEAWQRTLVARGIRTVAPLVPPVAVGEGDAAEQWVAYPRLLGREWDGGADDLAAAGRLLGRMHAASDGLAIDGFPPFEWGSAERSSIDEDVEAIRASAAEHWPHADADRWIAQLEAFGDTLERMRAAGLPHVPVSLDHRAANLLFDAEGALMVDLENASLAPRILDLAVAALLFPLEHPGAAGSALGGAEWAAFRGGYLSECRLTRRELELWPTALTYMKLEWGTWHLTEGVEPEPEGNLAYLEDLLTLDEHARFPLG
ncbi:phosphotransferase enzyme family protein [Agrococcus carbonis]|uniref:Ser/Thr protein kinase RdoA involved in Cpx stress response, MazF antagonist n=1 Tax=Agrococcus carbonis TaxID=684552 RepID=A0A1H1L641_9MICO|nr:hypothetical protein [Agrococcus carbonis]SDR69943.1 Ser/Thr protein kinase RdoA involved in Cpx stress response, MazF antagonist [Agrococcus carbonis]